MNNFTENDEEQLHTLTGTNNPEFDADFYEKVKQKYREENSRQSHNRARSFTIAACIFILLCGNIVSLIMNYRTQSDTMQNYTKKAQMLGNAYFSQPSLLKY